MRLVVRLDVLNDDDTVKEECVAKMFKSEAAKAKEYLNEAITQVTCQMWAENYNALPVPVKVNFLPVTVMELVDRPGKDLINVEPWMRGKFYKHNDNAGRVKSDRHTPQAFSHFSWEASNHTLLICDIQGVGDQFTDPQIHSLDGVENGNAADGTGFGPGNFGSQGIQKFFSTHKCNRLCKQLGLPELNNNLTDDQMKQPSTWNTSFCKLRNDSPVCGTCSRLSPSRINTTAHDKLRGDEVDYPDLQAPKQPTVAEEAPQQDPPQEHPPQEQPLHQDPWGQAHENLSPKKGKKNYYTANEMLNNTALRHREMLADFSRQAPHLFDDQDTQEYWQQQEYFMGGIPSHRQNNEEIDLKQHQIPEQFINIPNKPSHEPYLFNMEDDLVVGFDDPYLENLPRRHHPVMEEEIPRMRGSGLNHHHPMNHVFDDQSFEPTAPRTPRSALHVINSMGRMSSPRHTPGHCTPRSRHHMMSRRLPTEEMFFTPSLNPSPGALRFVEEQTHGMHGRTPRASRGFDMGSEPIPDMIWREQL